MAVAVTNSAKPLMARVGAAAYKSRRRIATAMAAVLAVVLGYHVVAGQNGLTIYQRKRVENRELAQQIDRLKQENARLKEHVDRLRNDPDAIEHEAREKLHYTRPGEVIYTLNDAPNDASGVSAKPAPPGNAGRQETAKK